MAVDDELVLRACGYCLAGGCDHRHWRGGCGEVLGGRTEYDGVS